MFTAVANGALYVQYPLKALYPVALIIILHMEISPVIVTSGLSTAEPEFTSNAIEMMDMNLTKYFHFGVQPIDNLNSKNSKN
ncbi:hypothetical protein BT96DRAFT_1027405 [Gymnopus androsaceus JB14]|uniref:Uncharacterized protein n=1 Tax=Gymnopus androsaceus JB14 TaxID=1447944 RepID=A0A6A4GC26_9AGAR|nr:hypothetical protein BT96DRAFT_1027405 [Gymnopus androsaceus JB14]